MGHPKAFQIWISESGNKEEFQEAFSLLKKGHNSRKGSWLQALIDTWVGNKKVVTTPKSDSEASKEEPEKIKRPSKTTLRRKNISLQQPQKKATSRVVISNEEEEEGKEEPASFFELKRKRESQKITCSKTFIIKALKGNLICIYF